MLLIGMCTSLTKKPTKPMIRKPIIVADAIRASKVSALTMLNLRYNDLHDGERRNLRDAVSDHSQSFVKRSTALGLDNRKDAPNGVVLEL